MARIETQAQLAKDKRRRLEEMSETGSCVSGISAYTGKQSVATVRSSVSAPARPVKGRMGMLPMGARATSSHGRPPSPTGSVQSNFSVSGSTVGGSSVAGSTRRQTRGTVGGSRVAGPAGGRSGVSGATRRSGESPPAAPCFAPTAVGLNSSPPPPGPGGKFSFVGGASSAPNAAGAVAGGGAASGGSVPQKGGFVPKFKPRTVK
jgi:hypothetical protein